MSKSPYVDRLQAKPKGLASQWIFDEARKIEEELRAEINKYLNSDDIYFFQKYAYLVKKDWYGFDLGSLPDNVRKQLDKLIQDMVKDTPDMKILQCKRKFNNLRLYMEGYNQTKFDDRIAQLESILLP